MEEYQEAFARIERAVDEGQTDLAHLGFWRLLRGLRGDPVLAAHWAEAAGRIDRKAFEARVRPRFPVWVGNLVLLAGTAAALVAVWLGLRLADGSDTPEPVLSGLLVLAGGVGLGVTAHSPAHWLAGRVGRIRFIWYFLNGPFRIQPGIKTDYASYLRAGSGARARMHAAGALATKIAPFAVFAWVYFPHRAAHYDLLPPWTLWGLLAVGVVQIVTDVVWSTRKSDWKKVRRELGAVRSR